MAIRYIGHPDGVELSIPVGNGGEVKHRHIPHGGELPEEIGGQKVPDAYRASLLEQATNWTEADAPKPATTKNKGDK